jgi:pilus assembly protein Flp/PilA
LRWSEVVVGRRCRFIASQGGATAIEYALIAALISAFIITAVLLLGSSLDAQFTGIADTAAEASPTGL